MKRFFAFLLLGILISAAAMAQVRTRNVPFLPYAGAPMREDITQNSQNGGALKKTGNYRVIFFDKNSSELREDQTQKLIQVGKWLEKEGGDFYTVRAFTSPDISTDLAQRRVETITSALSDFKIGMPLIQYEHRRSPVLNANRVEIYP